MTLFEMLIFVADKISSERNYSKVDYYRRLAQKDLVKAFQELTYQQWKEDK